MRPAVCLRTLLALGGVLLASCDAFDEASTRWNRIEQPGFARELKGNVLPAASVPVRLRARYVQEEKKKDTPDRSRVVCVRAPCNQPHVYLQDPYGRARIELGPSADPEAEPFFESDRVYVFSGELLYPAQPYTGTSSGTEPVKDWSTPARSIILSKWRVVH